MKTVEIVTHCWAAEHPHFADLLLYQLSSLELHRSCRCCVTVTVCFCPEDRRTMDLLEWYGDGTHQVRRFPMSADRLGRRCIGRNAAAKTSKADLVWFADCDHMFREGCLDRLAAMPWPELDDEPASMVFPRTIEIHRDHATGDRAAERIRGTLRLADVDPAEFVGKRYSRAIGGVQIVRGGFARGHGYLDGDPAWQRPAEKPFGDFRDDVAYRRHCVKFGPIVGVDLPGVYRIRHSQTTHT